MLRRLFAIAALTLLTPQAPRGEARGRAREGSITTGPASDPSPFVLRSEGDPGRPAAPLARSPMLAVSQAATPRRPWAVACTVNRAVLDDDPRTTVRRLPGRRIPRMEPDEPPRA